MTTPKIIYEINNHYLKKSYFAEKLGMSINRFSNLISPNNSAKLLPRHKTVLIGIINEFNEFDKKITLLTH